MSLQQGRIERDNGVTQTADSRANGPWIESALAILDVRRVSGLEFSANDLRGWLTAAGIGEPPGHVNAWGAVLRIASLRGLILDTGRNTQVTHTAGHARRLPIWRFA